MDLLKFLLDFLLLDVVLRVDGLLQLLVADGLGIVAIVDDETFALEALGDGLEVVLHGEHGLVDLVDLGLGALEAGVDVLLPGERVDAGLEVLVHLDDLREDQRALHLVQLALDAVLHEHDFVERPDVLAVVVGLVVDLQRLLGDVVFELLEVLDLLEQAHEVRVEVDDQRVVVLVALLEQLELQLVGALVPDEGGEVLLGVALVVLDFLLDGGEEFLDLLVLLALAERVGEDLVLVELGHEAVEDRLRPADGARGDGHVARHGLRLQRGARLAGVGLGRALHVVDVLLAADEDAVARLQVALLRVQQPELLLRDFFVDLRALDDLVEHFEEFEAREERRAVLETLRDDRGGAFVDVLHLAFEGAEVLAELLAGHVVADVHDVLVLAL